MDRKEFKERSNQKWNDQIEKNDKEMYERHLESAAAQVRYDNTYPTGGSQNPERTSYDIQGSNGTQNISNNPN